MGHIGAHRISEGWKLLILRAGDGDRTRDVQLGKLEVDLIWLSHALNTQKAWPTGIHDDDTIFLRS